MIGQPQLLPGHAKRVSNLTQPVNQIFAGLALADNKAWLAGLFLLFFYQPADIASADNLTAYGNLCQLVAQTRLTCGGNNMQGVNGDAGIAFCSFNYAPQCGAKARHIGYFTLTNAFGSMDSLSQ